MARCPEGVPHQPPTMDRTYGEPSRSNGQVPEGPRTSYEMASLPAPTATRQNMDVCSEGKAVSRDV